jgi:hypothetical protein
MDLRIRCTGDIESYRFGASRNQQRSELDLPAVLELHAILTHVDRRCARIEHEFDVVLGVVLGRSQWDPIVWRGPGKEVLGEIRPVAWRRVVGANHGHGTLVAFATKHVRGG